MDYGTIAVIATAIVSIVAAILGQKFSKYKNLLELIIDASKDGKVTEEEFQLIVNEVIVITGILPESDEKT